VLAHPAVSQRDATRPVNNLVSIRGPPRLLAMP
jgi:hypothetical protein